MNTNFYQSSVTPAGNSAEYISFGKASKATVPYGLAALVCSLFLAVVPTKAQYVTPSSYMNDLYIWWKNTPGYQNIKAITVRATFFGGTAHPAMGSGTPSIAIFEGCVIATDYGFGGQVDLGLFGPVVKGTGCFYDATDLDALSRNTGIPFMLYNTGNQLVLWMDLSSVWSNAKDLYFQFDKITSQGGWPWGNWTGLNGGVGSACGQVTLACSVQVKPQL
jgi:hypothetical protein